MFISKEILDILVEEAKKSPLLRMNMRTSAEDNSQRMLNALEPGTEVPIHRHRLSTETVTVLRGSVRQKFYNNDGNLIREDIIKACGPCLFYLVPQGMWHTTESLKSGTIIFESKDGKYEPMNPNDIMALKEHKDK